jgi:hypothetical protein
MPCQRSCVLSPNSRCSDQLIHGIKVLMARTYFQTWARETLKGDVGKRKDFPVPKVRTSRLSQHRRATKTHHWSEQPGRSSGGAYELLHVEPRQTLG